MCAAWPATSLLSRLNGQARVALLGLGTPIGYRARQVVFRSGEWARHAVLLLGGVATQVVDDVPVAVLGTGDLIEHRPRVDVVACVPLQARLIHSEQLLRFLHRHPDACVEVARSLAARLHQAQLRHADGLTCPPSVRVARVLLDVAERFGEVPLSQSEVSGLAGVALRTAEKALQDMENRGLVERCYRRIVITDLPGLRVTAAPVSSGPALHASD
ncbi:Crp/Fnr family transcriptional regulator [Lentzea sp. NBRC 105346]|nr:Crp/Fnr family transcriptional regulator [Lentzea sp. NBRC 105346]